MIIDTGPLVTLLSEPENHRYKACEREFERYVGELTTTLPCLTEAMYLIGNWHYRQRLWQWVHDGLISIHEISGDELSRMNELMEKYHDVPMDFADASLVATAEKLNANQIFTLDGDFRIYRLNNKDAIEIIP